MRLKFCPKKKADLNKLHQIQGETGQWADYLASFLHRLHCNQQQQVGSADNLSSTSNIFWTTDLLINLHLFTLCEGNETATRPTVHTALIHVIIKDSLFVVYWNNLIKCASCQRVTSCAVANHQFLICIFNMHVKKRLCAIAFFWPIFLLKVCAIGQMLCVFSVTFFFCLWFNALNTNFRLCSH